MPVFECRLFGMYAKAVTDPLANSAPILTFSFLPHMLSHWNFETLHGDSLYWNRIFLLFSAILIKAHCRQSIWLWEFVKRAMVPMATFMGGGGGSRNITILSLCLCLSVCPSVSLPLSPKFFCECLPWVSVCFFCKDCRSYQWEDHAGNVNLLCFCCLWRFCGITILTKG